MQLLQRSITTIIWLLIVIVLWVALSTPYTEFSNTFTDLNMTNSDTHIENVEDINTLVFNMIFGGLAVASILWFIIDSIREEPDWSRRGGGF